MLEEPAREQQRVVVIVPGAAHADLLVAALQANGVQAAAAVTMVRLGHEWVEGHAVSVAGEDEASALALLHELGAPPPPTPDDDQRHR